MPRKLDMNNFIKLIGRASRDCYLWRCKEMCGLVLLLLLLLPLQGDDQLDRNRNQFYCRLLCLESGWVYKQLRVVGMIIRMGTTNITMFSFSSSSPTDYPPIQLDLSLERKVGQYVTITSFHTGLSFGRSTSGHQSLMTISVGVLFFGLSRKACLL